MFLRSILQTGRVSILQPLIKTETCLAQQNRNTFVLKRRWEPSLAKKDGRPRILKARNFVYELIENGNVIKKPEIQLILTDYVNGLGYKGDLVTVKSNMAYNKLLLPGFAVYDTPANRAKYNTEERLKQERRSPHIQRTIDVFGKRIIFVCMNKTKPWVIEPWHIRASMRKAGLYVLNDSQIELPKTPITGPDPTKERKVFFVNITINSAEKARVRCLLHHVTLDPKKQEPYDPEWWATEHKLLFPDEEGQRPLEQADSESSPRNPVKN